MKKKLLTGLATAVFLVGIISISHATTFSDDFDDPDFTNSHWLDGNPLAPQTWSSVTLNGSDLGYHSTVDSLSTKEPAVKIADNGKEYNNAGLYIETLVRIDSHAAAYSTVNEKVFIAFSGTEENAYMAGIQLDFDGETRIDLYLSVHGDGSGQEDIYLAYSTVSIDFDTFYKLVVRIDTDQTMYVFLYDLNNSLLGSISSPKVLPFDKGVVAIGGRYASTFNDFYLSSGDVGWVTIQGNVTYDGTPLCAMVLANGQYMFSCDPDGEYQLSVPLDPNGEITLFAFVDGLAPFKVTSEPSFLPSNIEMQLASPDSKTPTVTSTVVESIDNPGWVDITGYVSLEGTPLCAMVLANGQYMFSCEPYGEYQLTVPLDPNGEITLFTFVDGLQPYKEIFSP